MFAILKTGGKQYRVAENDVIVVERLQGEAGDSVAFEDVLMVGDDKKVETGAPLVSGATVAGEILEQARGDKILIFKKKRRKNYRRTRGHRQDLSVVRITEILTGGKKPSGKKAAAKPAPKKAEEKPAEAKTETSAPPKEETKAAPKKTETKKAEGGEKKTAAKKPAAKSTAKKTGTKAASSKSGGAKKAPAKTSGSKTTASKKADDGKKE